MQFPRPFVRACCARALWIAGLTLPLILAAPHRSIAGESPAASTDSLQDLRKALEEEKERIRVLEQRLAAEAGGQGTSQSTPGAAAGNAAAGKSTSVTSSFGPDGFTLASTDGANVIRLRGNVSVDGRYFLDSYTPPTADTWLVRRLRPTLEGTLDGRYDFRIMPDFGLGKSIIQDAWAAARIRPWLVLTAGKFKAPLGLERLQLEQFARFVEPALTADLLPYRDLGFKVGGILHGGLLTYDLGLFNGVLDGGSTDGNPSPDLNSTGKFTWEGRLFAKPFVNSKGGFWQGLGAGIAASYVNNRGSATSGAATSAGASSLLASYKTTGQQPLFSYRSNTQTGGTASNATVARGFERRLVPQFFFYRGPVGLLGEYVQVDQQVQRPAPAPSVRAGTLRNNAWQLQASFFITGEAEGYDKATPRHEVGHGGPGAWELVARYHAIRFDDSAFEGGVNSFANPATAARSAHAAGVGINWYLTRNVKTQLDYEVTHFQGGAPGGNRPAEQVLTSQFALIF